MLRLVIAVLFSAAAAAPVTAQTCPEVRFASGASSGIVSGEVPGIGGMCLGLGVRPGQTVTLELLEGSNIWISYSGSDRSTDGTVRFTTTQSRYRIELIQKTRAYDSDPFQLRVTIR